MTPSPLPAVSLPVAHSQPSFTQEPRLLTAEQVAARWQVPKTRVYRLTRESKLAAVKIGRHYRCLGAAVEAFELAGGAASD